MDFNQAMKEVHETAVAHGWWDSDRDPREAVALMHSELSEALEESRKGRPLLYSNPEKPEKIEGIGVELIDCVIRMMDFMGHYDIAYVTKSERPACGELANEPLPILICELHTLISMVFWLAKEDSTDFGIDPYSGEIYGDYDIGWCFSNVIDVIFEWLSYHGASPESIFNEKAEYNKSRPYKHGKAF